MSAEFVEAARQRLGLNDAEADFTRRADLRSYDRLFDLLLICPSLSDGQLGIRRDLLMEQTFPLLSTEYRKVLDMPAPPAWFDTAALAPVEADDASPPPPDWPALGQPVALDGPKIDLRFDPSYKWPVPDQGLTPCCVGYAAAAALERRRAEIAGGVPRRLSPVFLYRRSLTRAIKAGLDLGRFANRGGTKLGLVRDALLAEGVCTHAEWPDTSPHDQEPPAAALAAAAQGMSSAVAYWDLGKLAVRWPGVARSIHGFLALKRPVAITIPVYVDPVAQPGGVTNWNSPGVWASGMVHNPVLPLQPMASGHAVCILGFQPDPLEPLGGHFIFRDSKGQRFGYNAPPAGNPQPPRVPERGYGALSASHVENHLFELFAPAD